MVTEKSFKRAFGSKSKAAKEIGTSRVTIDQWIKDGNIPERCERGLKAGVCWHNIIKKLGFNPQNLRKL